ncbi:hypothetical protein HBA54_17410 [Pelagibius litoralis]|uniref:CobW C-terminal domain-containing protein n=1 Tax=Pelagibius litoralis TaxID=374515 RepID=A0A967EZQ6_9PROT|nr:GTP-binding protein [Pelagibius litoralis]NIA70385.1 hypothetical protein [Pelagibius litoralis]
MNKAAPNGARVPIVLIGGFLGAGKTSLINHLLVRANGRKLAVFVNDFGAINLDRDLIETEDESKISFRNGCVCCTLNDDFVRTITAFLQGNAAPDVIVVEISGVADPRQMGASLVALENAGIGRFDAHVYMLDAANFFDMGFEHREMIIEHAACADILVLNKSDLAESRAVIRLRDLISDATEAIPAIEADFGKVDEDLVFGPQISRRDDFCPTDAGARSDHAAAYTSFSVSTKGCIHRAAFENFAAMLPRFCFRAKGLVRFIEDPTTLLLFNLVSTRATLEKFGQKNVQPDNKCKFVMIAKESGEDLAWLESSLHSVFNGKTSRRDRSDAKTKTELGHDR